MDQWNVLRPYNSPSRSLSRSLKLLKEMEMAGQWVCELAPEAAGGVLSLCTCPLRTVLDRNTVIQTWGITDLKLGLFSEFCQQGQFSASVHPFTKQNPWAQSMDSEVTQIKAQNRRENLKLYKRQCERGWGGQVEQGEMCTTACLSAEWRWAAWVQEVRQCKGESTGLENEMLRKGRKKKRRNLLFKCHSLSIGFMIWEILPEWHLMWDIVMWALVPGDALRN